jgi:hypothetical protein
MVTIAASMVTALPASFWSNRNRFIVEARQGDCARRTLASKTRIVTFSSHSLSAGATRKTHVRILMHGTTWPAQKCCCLREDLRHRKTLQPGPDTVAHLEAPLVIQILKCRKNWRTRFAEASETMVKTPILNGTVFSTCTITVSPCATAAQTPSETEARDAN